MSRLENYSIKFTRNVVPGAIWNDHAHIYNNNSEFKLRSVFFDAVFYNLATNEPLNLHTQNVVFYILNIGDPIHPAGDIAKTFQHVPVALTLVDNGTTFFIREPKQIVFNSFFNTHDLIFDFVVMNMDLFVTYVAVLAIVAEIEVID